MPVGAKIFDICFTVFVYLVAAAILIGAILFAFSTRPDKSIFGYRYYNVLTGSMSPVYNVGDMIFVKISDKGSDIKVGDVITFNPSLDSDAYLTHRVTEKVDNYEGTGKTCFRTKGDANDSGDSFLIEEDRVVGKVTFGIPALGSIVTFVKIRWYLIVPIIIMILVFFKLLKKYFLMGAEDDEDDQGKKDEKSDKPEETDKPENTETEPKEDGGTDGEDKAPETEEPVTESGEEKPEDDKAEESAEDAPTEKSEE